MSAYVGAIERETLINVSKTTPLKRYTLYSPPNHPDGAVHKTKHEADVAEAAAHHS